MPSNTVDGAAEVKFIMDSTEVLDASGEDGTAGQNGENGGGGGYTIVYGDGFASASGATTTPGRW